MPGMNKTNAFMLGTATVMLGPQEDLFDLTPATHSIGAVKNFTMTSEPTYTELTLGVRNDLAHSIMTQNPVRATMEVFEFTARNLTYGLGLDGSKVADGVGTSSTVATSATGGSEIDVKAGDGANFTVGDIIAIDVDGDENVLIRTIGTIDTDSLTLTEEIPASVTVPVGAEVHKVSEVNIGSKAEQPFLSAKIVGRLADESPLVLLVPKVRITRGFTLAFTTDDYGNLPFEFSVYNLAATDPHFAEFGRNTAKLYRT